MRDKSHITRVFFVPRDVELSSDRPTASAENPSIFSFTGVGVTAVANVMDFGTVVRQGFLFLHTVSFAIALSAVLREDVALARARCINARRLSDTARTVTYALIVLWVTGLALVGFNVGLDVRALIADPKLAAKICVVSVLTANGLALHALAFPILRRQRTRDRFSLFVPVVLGAISTVSWLYASFVGVSRLMAPLMSFTDFIALYGVLLAGAIVFALVFIRPRVERLLAAGRVKVGVASKSAMG